MGLVDQQEREMGRGCMKAKEDRVTLQWKVFKLGISLGKSSLTGQYTFELYAIIRGCVHESVNGVQAEAFKTAAEGNCSLVHFILHKNKLMLLSCLRDRDCAHCGPACEATHAACIAKI